MSVNKDKLFSELVHGVINESMYRNLLHSENFVLGAKVKVIHSTNNRTINKIGTIANISESGNIGVAFDEFISGHSCNGKVKNGNGWYIMPKNLKLLESEATGDE